MLKKVKSYPIKLWKKGLIILKQAPRKLKKIYKSFPKVISHRSGPGGGRGRFLVKENFCKKCKFFYIFLGDNTNREIMVNAYTLILHIGSVAWILLRNVFSSDGEKQRVGYLNKQSRINMETACLYIFKTKDATEITNYYY